MSVLGACWAHAYFEKEVYFGRKPIFGQKIYFGKDLFFKRKTEFWRARNRLQESIMQKMKENQYARGKAMWRAGR
jgi:hypothetical protein